MIVSYHGYETDLYHLRARHTVSLQGLRLDAIIAILDHMRFESRALRLEVEQLQHLQAPAILHWNLNHFVVLKKATARQAFIIDPAGGEKVLSIEEASRHFTGIALEVSPRPDFVRKDEAMKISLGSVLGNVRGFYGAGIPILMVSIALLLVGFALPIVTQLVIDKAVLADNLSLLNVLALAFLALIVSQFGLELLRARSLQIVSNMLSYQFVGRVIGHLFRLKAEFFFKRDLADMLSRIQSVNYVQDTITRGGLGLFIDGAMVVISVGLLALYSPLMTVVVVLCVLINFAVSWFTFPSLRYLSEQSLTSAARTQSHLMESIRAMTVIKVLGKEGQRESGWRNLFVSQLNRGFRASSLQIYINGAQTLVSSLQLLIILYLGSRAVIEGPRFSIGMLYAFLSFRQIFSDRSAALISQISQFRLLGLHLSRIGDIVLEPVPTVPIAELRRNFEGRIEFENVSFAYGAADPLVLRRLSLEVAPGEFVAIVGPSGSGKTTFLRLLLGIIEPGEGRISYDGCELASAKRDLFHQNVIGTVLQDDKLISGTIADNIAFFDPQIDLDRVRSVAQAAGIDHEISLLPSRYFTLVGDMGSALSGGQQQRILLARALYRNPKVLILDEGTANLDEENEHRIADVIAGLDITRIVVAHRPALVSRASRVLQMADGRFQSVR